MDQNYIKSNRILTVNVRPSDNILLFTRILLDSGEEHERQKFGEALLDELSDAAQIDIVKLKISNARQYHKRFNNKIVSKQYGYYKPAIHPVRSRPTNPVRGIKIIASNGAECAATTASERSASNGAGYIYIFNRTAARGQILAPKTFLDTLLHEWLHHYDYKKLGLARSIHSAGFYKRLTHLKELLKIF